MPSAPEPSPSAGDATLVATLRGMGGDLVRYLELKTRLAAIEGKEAGEQFTRALALSLLGLLVLAVADGLLMAALIPLATDALKTVWDGARWEYLAIAAALVHFGVAAGVLKAAKSKASRDVFPETLDQLAKDREWLNDNSN